MTGDAAWYEHSYNIWRFLPSKRFLATCSATMKSQLLRLKTIVIPTFASSLELANTRDPRLQK
jgi:hypothetical protein